MCGRFTQMMTWAELEGLYSIHGRDLSNLEPRYNISPTDPAIVVRRDSKGDMKLEQMRWWLVPFFWKRGLKEVPPAFNARAETVATTSMFKEAFQRRRCIVPASGFYEWTGEKKARLPWYITSTDGFPLSFDVAARSEGEFEPLSEVGCHRSHLKHCSLPLVSLLRSAAAKQSRPAGYHSARRPRF